MTNAHRFTDSVIFTRITRLPTVGHPRFAVSHNEEMRRWLLA
jgi:hypothetical protein